MEQVDRRIRRTQRSLANAFIALALEKEYEEITIQEITDRADIGYRTFFRHYSDKEELLRSVLGEMLEELRDLMGPPQRELFSDPNFKASDWQNGQAIFQHVQENSDLYRVLMRSERSLVDSVIDFTSQEIKAQIGFLDVSDIPIEIIANHMVSSTLALVRWWLLTDLSCPIEVMGEYAFILTAKPIREIIMQALAK